LAGRPQRRQELIEDLSFGQRRKQNQRSAGRHVIHYQALGLFRVPLKVRKAAQFLLPARQVGQQEDLIAPQVFGGSVVGIHEFEIEMVVNA
jgi:hypothetical protein